MLAFVHIGRIHHGRVHQTLDAFANVIYDHIRHDVRTYIGSDRTYGLDQEVRPRTVSSEDNSPDLKSKRFES